MKRIVKYDVTTADRVITLKPNAIWNVGRDLIFAVTGMSNSDYALRKFEEKYQWLIYFSEWCGNIVQKKINANYCTVSDEI